MEDAFLEKQFDEKMEKSLIELEKNLDYTRNSLATYLFNVSRLVFFTLSQPFKTHIVTLSEEEINHVLLHTFGVYYSFLARQSYLYSFYKTHGAANVIEDNISFIQSCYTQDEYKEVCRNRVTFDMLYEEHPTDAYEFFAVEFLTRLSLPLVEEWVHQCVQIQDYLKGFIQQLFEQDHVPLMKQGLAIDKQFLFLRIKFEE